MLLPLLFAVVFVAVLSTVVGVLILRRRGVYFSLLTLALCGTDLYHRISLDRASPAARTAWAALKRVSIGPLDLNDSLAYYVLVALVASRCSMSLLRVVRSPFGHVLVAIRENQQRATFQGYDVDRYRLGAFVLSAVDHRAGRCAARLPELSRHRGDDVGARFPANCWPWW